jgi:hypothetical protein
MAKKFRARISFFVAQRYKTSTEWRERNKVKQEKSKTQMAH